MKTFVKGFLSLLCAGTMAFGFAACNKKAESAYDIAVRNGFVGTEEEWLRSLHGADGADAEDLTANDLYEQAKANGYEGSYLDFCKELNIEAIQGNDVEQIAENVMSVVGVYCGFASTTGGGLGKPSSTTYSMSMGSGVIIDLNKQAGNALVLTNYHVLYNEASNTANGISDNIYLYLFGALNKFSADKGDVNGNGMRATYVGGAMDYDIALLKIEGSKYLQNSAATEAKIGDSEQMNVGEEVFAIGNPDGAGISVTSGVLSMKSEYVSISALDGRDEDKDGYVDEVSYRVMRTDAAINGGNSGGALFNAQGELIGITNAKSVGEEKDNMGYALPMTQMEKLCDNIMDNGGVVKCATLGIAVTVTNSSADSNLEVTEEVTVARSAQSTTASSYGKFREGDIFQWVEYKGERTAITRRYQVNEMLLTVRKGDSVSFGILRDGYEVTVTITFDQDSYFTVYS